MPNGKEEAAHLKIRDITTHQILDLDASQWAAAFASIGLDNLRVPDDLDFGVLERPGLHDLGSPEGVPAVDDVDMGAVLGEEVGFLHGGVAAAYDGDGLVPKDGGGAVADGAGGDAAVPVRIGAGEVEASGDGPRGDDDGVGENGGRVGGDTEGAGREVDGGDGLGEDVGAEAEGLRAAAFHEVGAHDAVGEAREVLDIGGGGELPARGDVVGHPALEEHGLELRARGVDGRRVRGWGAPDDADARAERRGSGSVHGCWLGLAAAVRGKPLN